MAYAEGDLAGMWRLAYWNGLLWALGNGFVGSMLLVYLVQELAGDSADRTRIGLVISLVLAAPHLAGVLRLAAPTAAKIVGSRKTLCIFAYLLSAVVLTAIPFAPLLTQTVSAQCVLLIIAVFWCVYHLFEYFGTVALWSWFGDLAPTSVRGRFLAERQRWMLIGQIAAMLTAGFYTWGYHAMHPDAPRWLPYAVCAGAGSLFLAAAIAPLTRIPGMGSLEAPSLTTRLRRFLRPFTDGGFARLIVFGCWLSFCNGVTQAAQGRFPYVLGLTFFAMLALRTGMRTGQWCISPIVGRTVDRLGGRPVMAAALPIIALGPLFYYAAGGGDAFQALTIGGRDFLVPNLWIVAAWIAWIAWAGVNVALPSLMLKLSPHEEERTSYVAAYYAVTGLCYGLSTLGGGLLFDALRDLELATPFADEPLGILEISLIAGWLLRTSAAVLLLVIIREPSVASSQRRS